MTKKTFLFSAICTGLLTLQACTSEEVVRDGTDSPNPEALQALSFSSNIGKAETRTVNAGSQWVGGDSIGIFMMGSSLGYSLQNSIETNRIYLNQSGTNQFRSSAAGQTIYKPADTEYSLRFISYYPYKEIGTDAGMIAPATFIYPIDLNSQKDTAHIDVLYSRDNYETPVALPPTGMVTSVHLQFEHVLSKIIVNVKKAVGSDVIIPGMTAIINGMPATASLNLNSGAVTPTGDNSSMLNLVSIKKTAGYDTTFQAIIVPHLGSAMSSRVQLLTVRKLFTWPIPASFDFAPGMVYTFNLTLNGEAIIEFSADITPWGVGGSDSDDIDHDNSGSEYKKTIAGGADVLDVVYINKGTFSMGDNSISGATPHPVTLTHSFLMSQYEITNAQYAKFLNLAPGIVTTQFNGTDYVAKMDVSGLGANMPAGMTALVRNASTYYGVMYDGSQWTPENGKDNHPVIDVTYYGALAYANWAGGGDLPTSAQWEYAARAGSATSYINGITDATLAALDNCAWWNHAGDYTKAVGGAAYKNAWNLYDMSGNVSERCKDFASATLPAYTIDAEVDPLSLQTVDKDNVIVRGGSYLTTTAANAKLSNRAQTTPSSHNPAIGFRIIFPLQ